MRQQFVDAAVQLRGQAGQDVLEVGPRIMAIELGRLHQAHHDGRTLAGEFASAKEPRFSAHCPGTEPQGINTDHRKPSKRCANSLFHAGERPAYRERQTREGASVPVPPWHEG